MHITSYVYLCTICERWASKNIINFDGYYSILLFNYTLHRTFSAERSSCGISMVIGYKRWFQSNQETINNDPISTPGLPPFKICRKCLPFRHYLESNNKTNKNQKRKKCYKNMPFLDDHVQQIKQIKIPIFHYQIIFCAGCYRPGPLHRHHQWILRGTSINRPTNEPTEKSKLSLNISRRHS